MASSFYFVYKGFNPDKYGEAIRQLEPAGAGAPGGRTYRAGLEMNGEISVFGI
jgi:hypothetical protein